MSFDYVYGHDKLIADFVAELIPDLHGRALAHASKAMGIINEDGKLIAGVVWHNWDPFGGTIEMSGSATDPRWLTAETLKRMYQYPYLQLGCQLTYMRVGEDNERLLRQLATFNYAFHRLPRMLGRDKDMILCLLTREDWETNKFCRRYQHHLEDLRSHEAA